MQIEISVGEIVDKLSILQIKKTNISDHTKLTNIIKEFAYLYKVIFDDLQIDSDDYMKLLAVNTQLWNIEDAIRAKEQKKQFDAEFVSLARNVYITNDKRAEIKKELNLKYNSNFIEEKSYTNYESID